MGAPTMVGATFRLDAYNKKKSLKNLFINNNHIKLNRFTLKKNFTINFNNYKNTLNLLKNNLYKKYRNINCQNLNNIKNLPTPKTHNTIINSKNINLKNTRKFLSNKTNVCEKNINKINFLSKNSFYTNTTRSHASKTVNYQFLSRSMSIYGKKFNFNNIQNNKKPNKNFVFKNEKIFLNKENLKDQYRTYINIKREINKNNILKNITNRNYNEKNSFYKNNFLQKNKNIHTDVHNFDSNKQEKDIYSEKNIDFHEIMSFVEAELNQSLRSPPAGALMSWVQSVPSHPGLHI